MELEKILHNLNLALVNGKIENETVSKVLEYIFQSEMKHEIAVMKKQNQKYYQQAQILHNPPKTS